MGEAISEGDAGWPGEMHNVSLSGGGAEAFLQDNKAIKQKNAISYCWSSITHASLSPGKKYYKISKCS